MMQHTVQPCIVLYYCRVIYIHLTHWCSPCLRLQQESRDTSAEKHSIPSNNVIISETLILWSLQMSFSYLYILQRQWIQDVNSIPNSTNFWPLRNSVHHVHRDTVQTWVKTKLSFSDIWGCTEKQKQRGERNYADKKNKKSHQYSHWWVYLRLPTFKDGRTSFAIQKKLEHFPFTVKHDHLSINIQFTVQSFWVRNISTYMNYYSSRLNWPTCEMASTSTTSEPLAACCCWRLYRPILKTEPPRSSLLDCKARGQLT